MDIAIFNNAIKHFCCSDSVMFALAEKHKLEAKAGGKSPPYFHSLVEIVINQQLSVKAAATICERIRVAQGGPHFGSKKLLAMSEEMLRSQGLSKNKVRYVRAIANAVESGKLNFRKLVHQADEEIRSTLMELPGIGEWSADLFMLSTLGRTDIFPVGDLIIRKSMQQHYSVVESKGYSEYLEIADNWRPFRSVASRILWSAYFAD